MKSQKFKLSKNSNYFVRIQLRQNYMYIENITKTENLSYHL
jgi:hypothetical protein